MLIESGDLGGKNLDRDNRRLASMLADNNDRVSFDKIGEVIDLPDLLENQKTSYRDQSAPTASYPDRRGQLPLERG